MRCLPAITVLSDQPYWVSLDSFFKHFDQYDFQNRNCIDVSPVYLQDWFQASSDGTLSFILPVIQFVSGRTQFVNGRHRTAVLALSMRECYRSRFLLAMHQTMHF